MSNEKLTNIIEQLKTLTLLEASELVTEIENVFGVDTSVSVASVGVAAPVAGDGGAATGKSTGAKMIAKKYNLKFLSSGLLYRYATFMIIKYQPKNKVKFL